MKCPNCYSQVAGGLDKCPRCDWQLRAPAAPTSSAAFAESPTADPWAAGQPGARTAPVWTPDPPRSAPTWDAAPAPPSGSGAPGAASGSPGADDQGYWDTSGKASWEATPAAASEAPDWLRPAQPNAANQPFFPPSAAAPLGSPLAGNPLAGGAPGFPVVPPPPLPGAQDLPFTPPTVVSTVPLSGGQKFQLWFAGLFPLIVMGGMGAVFANMFRVIGGSGLKNLPWFLPIIIGLLLIFFLYQAVQNIRDASSGTANIQADRLIRTWRVRNKNSVNYYGQFAGLGKMRISRDLFNGARDGMVYQITYSPATKRVWAMQLSS